MDTGKCLPGWSSAGFSAEGPAADTLKGFGGWSGTEALDIDKSLLKARLSLPVIVKETRKPVAVTDNPGR